MTYTAIINHPYGYDVVELIYTQRVSPEGTMLIGMIISGIVGGLILWKYNGATYKNPIIGYYLGDDKREMIPLFPIGNRKKYILAKIKLGENRKFIAGMISVCYLIVPLMVKERFSIS